MASAILTDVPDRWWSKDTVAVVTGSSKGIGYGIVLELARHGITVVSTARDPERGLAAIATAVEEEPELAEFIHFHRLDVTNEQSVTELAAWLQSKLGGIDILVNNAGVSKMRLEVYEDAVETVEANYAGAKRVTEQLLPLFRASPHGARIVMISSFGGLLQHFGSSEYIVTKIQEALENVDKSIVDSMAVKYLEDVKRGRVEEEKWARNHHHYSESKLFLNIYTRVLAQELLSRGDGHKIYVTAMHPGTIDTAMTQEYFAKLDPVTAEQMKRQLSMLTVEEGAKAPVRLALLPTAGYPHGKFFMQLEESAY